MILLCSMAFAEVEPRGQRIPRGRGAGLIVTIRTAKA